MTPTPTMLLRFAREVRLSPDLSVDTLWGRCRAVLIRQALERTLDALWDKRAPALRVASRHSQFLCLPTYLREAGLAGQMASAWAALSNACHYRSYEFAPTDTEVEDWLASVEAFVMYCDNYEEGF
jgi:hypothetical protein